MFGGKCVEGSELLKIPSEKFEDYSTWIAYETVHWYPTWVWATLTVICLCLSILKGTAENFSVYFIVFDVLGLWFFLTPVFLSWRKRRLLNNNRSLLAAVVDSLRPGVSVDAWNEVTVELNALLYREGIWRTPYFVFDGASCLAKFRCYLPEPYHKAVSSEDLENNVEMQAPFDYEESVRESF